MEDLAITERLQKAGELLGIPLMDHLVIGHGSYVALRSRMRWPGQ
jgi:DNA repair protein RadC